MTEKKVAETILQEKDMSVTIGGKAYEFGKPTVGTMIMVSSLIAQLPPVDAKAKGADIVREVLRTAKNSAVIGEIAAVLILGAKRVQEHRKVSATPPFTRPWWAFWRSDDKSIVTDEKTALAAGILNEMSVAELQELIISRISDLQVGSFFGLTTSLTTANILRPTRSGVDGKTTVSGQ